jgi:hypothetical protein
MIRTAIVVSWILVSSASSAAAEAPSTELIVPTRMCGEYFLIPIEVDLDRDGKATTLTAVFDTGGAGLHIDPDAVVRAGGAPVGERKQITIREARAGPLTFRKLRPYTRELDHLSKALGTEIDVFLPYREFKEQLLTLDFPRRELRVRRGELPPPDGVRIFDSRGGDRRPYLNVEIAGKRHRLLIDSGSSGSIGLGSSHDLPWLSPPLPVKAAQGMERVYFEDVGRLGVDLQLAGITIERPLVELRGPTPLLGTDVMQRFAWTFDQKSRRVEIIAASPEPLRMPPLRGTGAVSMVTPAGREVVRVLDGSPAARAGLRAGDVIVAVNGTAIAERGCERWNTATHDETTLTISRGTGTFDVRLEVVDLVR